MKQMNRSCIQLVGKVAGGLAILSLLSSCVFPVVSGVPQGRRPFDKESVEPIEIGVTTKERVRAILAAVEPGRRDPFVAGPYSIADERWWVYRATRDMWRRGWGWIVCLGGPYVADCVGRVRSSRGKKSYFLLIEFDSSGVVREYQVYDSKDLTLEIASHSILIGQTTASEVSLMFGAHVSFDGGKVSVYSVPPDKLAQQVCPRRNAFGCAGDRERFLRVTFDESGVAEDVEVVRRFR